MNFALTKSWFCCLYWVHGPTNLTFLLAHVMSPVWRHFPPLA